MPIITKSTYASSKNIACFLVAGSLLLLPFQGTSAQNEGVPADELNARIEDRKSEIQQLEEEIEKDRAELQRLSGEKNTLSNEIKLLDLSRNKLEKEISVTTNRIAITDSEINELEGGIAEKERARTRAMESLAETLRSIQRIDDTTFEEMILSKETLGQVWQDVDMVNSIQAALGNRLASLLLVKTELVSKKSDEEAKRQEYASYQKELSGQKAALDYTAGKKNSLLRSVRNEESEYQKLLAEKLAKKEAFERELQEIEAELRFITDPSMIPPPEKGMLRWPLQSVKITQVFGDTEFSRANPGVYNGKGHNGIDLGAPIGTPILAAASGIVEGTGDTDTVCPNASYGKWILVRHKNGLSTLYAHLSVISVSPGEEVSVGETIGYIGVTGYTTGPHLHFTVYATAGVKILDKKSAVCRGTYQMPIADLRAYLNPLLYLPS